MKETQTQTYCTNNWHCLWHLLMSLMHLFTCAILFLYKFMFLTSPYACMFNCSCLVMRQKGRTSSFHCIRIKIKGWIFHPKTRIPPFYHTNSYCMSSKHIWASVYHVWCGIMHVDICLYINRHLGKLCNPAFRR